MQGGGGHLEPKAGSRTRCGHTNINDGEVLVETDGWLVFGVCVESSSNSQAFLPRIAGPDRWSNGESGASRVNDESLLQHEVNWTVRPGDSDKRDLTTALSAAALQDPSISAWASLKAFAASAFLASIAGSRCRLKSRCLSLWSRQPIMQDCSSASNIDHNRAAISIRCATCALCIKPGNSEAPGWTLKLTLASKAVPVADALGLHEEGNNVETEEPLHGQSNSTSGASLAECRA